MDNKINAPSLADAVSEEMKAQLNIFHHTLSHGSGVIKNCMKEGNDTTTTSFHTFKGAIGALLTKDDMQEISSTISSIMEKHIGATLSSSTKKQKTTHVALASPYNISQPPEVACITLFYPILEPTLVALHMTA
jgi:dsRNA-specific ribonuclease